MTNNKPIALITGGSGFLGSAISTELLNTGWHIISLSRSVSPKKEIESYICDITNEIEVNKVAKIIIGKYKEINAIIHTSATKLVRKPLLETPIESFEKDIRTSVFGAFFIAQNFLPHIRNGSAFIGITTEAIENPKAKNLGSYISTKQALRGLLQSMSREISPEKVRIYAVAPGFLPGGLNRDLPKTILDLMSQKNKSGINETVRIVSALCKDPKAYQPSVSINVSTGKVTPL